MRRFVLAAAVVIATAACASAPGGTGAQGMRNRNVLTAEEIQTSRAPGWTAHELIAQLRPEYLRSRGVVSLRSTGPATAAVYLDGLRFGQLESLRTLSATQILRIEYINAADATTRFGTDHVGGAILISTKLN